MNALSIAPLLAVLLVFVQFVVPGKTVYHYGWFNVLVAALLVMSIYWWRAVAKRAPRHAAAAAIAVLGVCTIGVAGIANGLFAPDDSTVIGAPGASVPVADLGGSLVFPLVDPGNGEGAVVRLYRGGSTVAIPANGVRFSGGFMLSQQPRSVVAIDARDAHGVHLTITQPSGTTFLSPVLTLAQTQTLRPGMTLPFDSFAVPAAHRNFNVVFFDARTAATLPRVDSNGRALVLFAAEDEEGRPLPDGLRYALDGQRVSVGGLQLQPLVLTYPAVRVVAVPLPIVAVIGSALVVAGIAWALALVRRRVDAAVGNQ